MEKNLLTFHKADEMNKNIGLDISRIFVDGFYQWLKYFSKDKEKLSNAFSHIFQLDAFYVAIYAGSVSAIAACPREGEKSVKLIKKEFIRHLGFLRGRIAYMILHKEFELKPYPFDIPSNLGQIEFVATAEAFRGKEIAFNLLNHIIAENTFDSYVLEVADTNIKAMKLYERIGFKEFKRIPEKNPKQSGLNFYVYMRFDKNM